MDLTDQVVVEACAADLVPFVGAGASRAVRDAISGRPLIPSWREFLELAAQRLDEDAATACLAALTAEDMVLAASIIRQNMHKPTWMRLLKSTFEISRHQANPDDLRLQRAIWRASRGLVITTNYDDALSWEVPTRMSELRTYGLEANLDVNGLFGYGQREPVLWHLHGRIRYPNDIVLASEGYESLYVLDRSMDRRYSAALTALGWVASSKSLLFVGFSLNDSAITKVLHDMHVIFNTSDRSHYLICSEAERPQIEARIDAAKLDNVELIPVADFGQPLLDMLERLRKPGLGEDVFSPTSPRLKHQEAPLRRRCRAVVAGSETFIARIRPMLAEHRPSTASNLLFDLAMQAEPGYEASIARAIRYEFDFRPEQMLAEASWHSDDPLREANCALFRGLALEKLNRFDDSVAEYQKVLELAAEGSELHTCARFNLAVTHEKMDSGDELFAPFMDDRELQLSTGELLWIKAFNMELIRCRRRRLPFRYESLLEEALREEIDHASTGFAKTLINWSSYSGKPFPPEYADLVDKLARRASVSVRIPMLSYLQAVVPDPALAKALDDALDATGRPELVLRLLGLPDQRD